MSTDKFSKTQFEDTLIIIATAKSLSWRMVGFVQGELRYTLHIRPDYQIQINSSIDHSGYAADTGENSIRVWLTNDQGKPLAKKEQAYVTRAPGWVTRLSKVIDQVLETAQSLYNTPTCPKCGGEMVARTRKSDGGQFYGCRKFPSCNGTRNIEDAAQPMAAKPLQTLTGKPIPVAPTCPKCNAPMAMRTRRSDGSQFYGCTRYPSCNGTRNLNDVDTDTTSTVDLASQQAINEKMEMKQRFADREAQEERAAFESDPDYQASLSSKLSNTLIPALESQPAETAKPKEFAPSKYQTAIWNWVTDTVQVSASYIRALVVEAVAGSGKTTTGLKMLERIPTQFSVVFVSYNKGIAIANRKKAPKHVKVSTYHSLGFGILVKALDNGSEIKLDDELGICKTDMILEPVLDRTTQKHLYGPVKSLVELVKANLVEPTPENLSQLADYHGIELNGDEEVIYQAVAYVIEHAAKITNIIDFDDMCWLPVILNLRGEQYDVVFVDEFQDTNKCMGQLAIRLVKPGGILIGVGDRYQSIYGFRGADAEAIPNLIHMLDAETLPLSITYRNPKCVVRLCNQKWPEIPIEAAEWAEEGIIRSVSGEKAIDEYKVGDMVICRTNAPLVEPVFELIRRGIKATIRGRDIGKGLVAFIRKMRAVDIHDLVIKASEYQKVEVAKLVAAEKNTQAQALEDKIQTIIALADGCTNVGQVEAKIDAIFSDKSEGVVFSSIHRAKGLEAERVYILHPELLPHPMAKKDWEKRQERNIEYVAYTRTLHELVFVND
jgi:DNA helicase-2/ATP-dependent DNA helicase PcrA